MEQKELQQAILEEKKKHNTFIVAHTYQRPEILAIADITGDSFALSTAAQKVDHSRVLMCGVRFMAETVKILSPEKQVILAKKDAGCPMAEQINPEEVAAYKKAHSDHVVCAYVNTTAELKALSDVCVTSSTAVKIVKKITAKDILFLPDKNLGSYVQKMLPEKNIHLMHGYCPVHNVVRGEDIDAIRKEYPKAVVAIHPECPIEAVEKADMVGSTKDIIAYTKKNKRQVVLVTEKGVYDQLFLQKDGGDRFIQLLPQKMVCADMKKTTLQDIYDALIGIGGEEITMDESLRLAAKGSIENMIKYGK